METQHSSQPWPTCYVYSVFVYCDYAWRTGISNEKWFVKALQEIHVRTSVILNAADEITHISNDIMEEHTLFEHCSKSRKSCAKTI